MDSLAGSPTTRLRLVGSTRLHLLLAFLLGMICGTFYLSTQDTQIRSEPVWLATSPRPSTTSPGSSTTLPGPTTLPSEPTTSSGPVWYKRLPVNTSFLDCSANKFLRLMFVVMSTPNDIGARKRSVVRESWPLTTIYKPPSAVHVILTFVLGTSGLPKQRLLELDKENASFGDLLMLKNHRDTYKTLTKKVQLGMQWADRNADFDYLIKTDDDVVVLLDKMEYALRHMGCPQRLYWGGILRNIFVQSEGKWKETNWTICEKYLPYATGNGYVLGRQLVRALMKYGDHLRLYANEDVTVGAWLAPYNHTTESLGYFSLVPTCSTDAILVHQEGSILKLERAAKKLISTGKLC